MNNESSHSLKTLAQHISDRLRSMYSAGESRQLALMALEHVAGILPQSVIMNDIVTLPANTLNTLEGIVGRLLVHEPIQYILGYADFYGRRFAVNPSVLIPRQETEELVNTIIKSNTLECPAILDIGTGSGCIAVTLALEIPGAVVTALDIEDYALQVASSNAATLGAQLKMVKADILSLDRLADTYTIIVSNPPYITQSEKQQMHSNVLHHEPAKALFVPDEDPLLFYREICRIAFQALKPDGAVYFEINERFGREMLQLCQDLGFSRPNLLRDLNGKDRIVKAEK